MAKFSFRLATLQKIREATRDELRSKLAEAYQAEQLLAEQIIATQNEAVTLQQSQRANLQNQETNINQVISTQRYQAVLQAQIATMKNQSQTLEAEIEKRRQALVMADQQVRVLDKLKERQRDAHRRDLLQKEAKTMDEIASRRQETEH